MRIQLFAMMATSADVQALIAKARSELKPVNPRDRGGALLRDRGLGHAHRTNSSDLMKPVRFVSA
jgi:hypothetical protein